jgi:PAS domain S-box-containing protein
MYNDGMPPFAAEWAWLETRYMMTENCLPDEARAECADAEAQYQQQVRERRKKALNILLASAFACAVILLAVVLWIMTQPGELVRDIAYFARSFPFMFLGIALSYALARWVSTDAGSIMLITSGIVIVTFSDAPERIAGGPALLAYAVPILAAGMLLPPWSTFLVAGLATAAVAVVSLQGQSFLLTVISVMLVLFMLALVTWYFARSLERSNRALHNANRRLREDIAERKQTEAQLRLMSHVVEQSPVSIAVMDQGGRFEYFNRHFCRLMGYTQEEATQLSWRDMQPVEAPPDVDAQIQMTLAAGKEWRAQAERTRRDGGTYWEAVTISVVRDAQNDTVHYLAIAEDVTTRHEAQQALHNVNAELERRVEERTAALRKANIALEHSARLKDEFLATMSHELRTPLTGILGAAEMLAEQYSGALNERQARSVQAILDSGQHLLGLINGILDLTKIEAGSMELDRQRVEVDAVCRNALTVVSERARQKSQAIAFTSRPAAMVIPADAIRLKQMLVNLLGNAVKFTPEGGRIGLNVEGDAAQEEIRFTVWDTGIGIAGEDIPRLFAPFVQLDSGLNRAFGGTGLGLTLVRKFAELHGGGVQVESSVGQGSRFTVVLPWPVAEGQIAVFSADSADSADSIDSDTNSGTNRDPGADTKADAGSEADGRLHSLAAMLGRRPRILLAEDNQTSIETVSSFLELLGCDLLVVQRGDDAVRSAGEAPPDLILMDIQMPHMDGLEAISLIRAHANANTAQTPILALTALAMPGDRERCLAVGANGYLSKPFTMRALLAAMQKLLADKTAPENSPQ